MAPKELATCSAEIVGLLTRQSIHYALVGGIAVSFRALERTTRNVDFVVVVHDDLAAEALIREIMTLGYEVHSLLEQAKHCRIATVRLIKGDESEMLVDLLFASSDIEQEVASRAEDVEVFPGLTIKVADISSLLALKVLSADDSQRP